MAAGKIPDARIAVVISNKPDAGGLEVAKRMGLEALVIPSKGKPREEHDREVVAALQQHKVDLVCLAGYMRLLSPWFVQQFPRRILNIHPSLLPSFPGLEAQEQAFAYGVKVTGCTVHFVDEELDHGAIIVQKAVPVLDTDDEHTLAARILEQEHLAYSEAINHCAAGKHEIVGQAVCDKRHSGIGRSALTFQISDCRFQIFHGTYDQLGRHEKPYQAFRSDGDSPVPVSAAKSGRADYHAPAASVRRLRGGKLPCRLPVAFKSRLRLVADCYGFEI